MKLIIPLSQITYCKSAYILIIVFSLPCFSDLAIALREGEIKRSRHSEEQCSEAQHFCRILSAKMYWQEVRRAFSNFECDKLGQMGIVLEAKPQKAWDIIISEILFPILQFEHPIFRKTVVVLVELRDIFRRSPAEASEI